MHKLKKSVKKAQNPIAQIVKRITEIDMSRTKHSTKLRCLYVSTNKKDSCLLLKNEDFAFVKERRPGKKYVCDVIGQHHLSSFFTKPCDSKLINIAVAKNIGRHTKRRLIEYSDIDRKAVCLPYDGGYLLLPLHHSVERR